MATKPRHRKTPMQLWVADNRKRLNLTSADLAALTGLSEDTARAWESRGRPSEDAIAVLERRFGVPAPRESEAVAPDGLVAALARQTEAITELVAELRAEREARDQVEERLRALEAAAMLQGQSDDVERRWRSSRLATTESGR